MSFGFVLEQKGTTPTLTPDVSETESEAFQETRQIEVRCLKLVRSVRVQDLRFFYRRILYECSGKLEANNLRLGST